MSSEPLDPPERAAPPATSLRAGGGPSPTRWVLPGTLALAGIVLAMTVGAGLSVAALSGARSVAQGESNWSRAQKDLVIGLQRYAATGEAEALALADEAAAFHLAVRQVLDRIQSGTATRAEIEAATARVPGFQGEARPFARAFVWFRGMDVVQTAVAEWSEAQDRVEALTALRDPLVRVRGDTGDTGPILAEIARLDRAIEDDRRRFLAASDDWTGVAIRGSSLALLLLGGVLVTGGSVGLAVVLRRLGRSESELAESRELFQQVTESIREVFWLTSADKTRAFYVSPGYEAVWGEPLEHAVANPMGWLDRVHPEDRQRVHDALPRQQEARYELEYRIRTPAGQVKWLRDRAFPVHDEAGRVVRIAGITADVTERRSLEQELLQAQKLRSVAHLAAGVAHEFNNLLTAIQSHLAFLESDLADRREVHEDLAGIRRAARRAGELTRKLLAYGRRQVVLPGPVRLAEFLAEVTPLLESLLPPRIALHVEAAEGLPPARADQGHLREVLLALVSNSRDAMGDGGTLRVLARHLTPADHGPDGVLIPVEGRALTGSDYLVLELVDNGPGIPEDIRHRIFEPFYAGRSGAAAQGLGLPAVLGLMEQMGGGVALDTTPGIGTSIRLLLPLEP